MQRLSKHWPDHQVRSSDVMQRGEECLSRTTLTFHVLILSDCALTERSVCEEE